MEERNYKVYAHRNKLNNKVYIGITSQLLRERWRNGNGYKGSRHFCSAIKKYGWDNFSHEVLFENLTKDEACEKEIEMIQLYESTNPDYGYNISKGGDKVMSGYHISEETKQKIREAHLGRKATPEAKRRISESRKGLLAGKRHLMYGKRGGEVPMYGKHHTQEAKRKMSKKHTGKHVGEKNQMYGKHHTKESIFKNRKNQPNRKAVICLNTQETFLSVMEASRVLNIWRGSITKVCDGKVDSVKGYRFRYLDNYKG